VDLELEGNGDAKMHYILQKINLDSKNGREYLYPNLCYIVPEIPLPTQNIQRIPWSSGYFLMITLLM